MKQPKYILAAHGGREWVVRTRNPFLVGRVERDSTGYISFDLWPQDIVLEIGADRCADLAQSMHRWYLHQQGIPYSQIERQLS